MTTDVDASGVAAAVKRLVRLRDAVGAVPARPDAAADWRRRALATVPAVLFTVGCVLAVWVTITFAPLDRRAVFLDSLRLSLPWLALFLVVGTQVFRLNTTSPSDLPGIVLFALIGFPLAGYAAEIALNCALDAAPAAEHRAIVIERTTSHSHRTTDYWAVVRSSRGALPDLLPLREWVGSSVR